MTTLDLRRLAAGLTLTAMALSAAACGTDNAVPTPALSQPPFPSASPTPSPTPESPEQAAITAAKQAIPRYLEVRDRALSEPLAADPEQFKKVAISIGLNDLNNQLAAYRSQGLRVVGASTVVSMGNPRVTLKNNPKITPPDIPTVQLDVCYDTTKTDVVDEAGKSTVPEDWPDRLLERVSVSNYSYPDPEQWKVVSTKVQEGRKC